jgi:hypothetical protein
VGLLRKASISASRRESAPLVADLALAVEELRPPKKLGAEESSPKDGAEVGWAEALSEELPVELSRVGENASL